MISFKRFLDKKTPTIKQAADKHGVSIELIKRQLSKGINVEKEHTNSTAIAKEIAMDHLGEDPRYYNKLKKMEAK